MRAQKERGRSVLFITHRLREVIAHCDRATVLRDGGDVGTLVPQEGGEEKIVEYMLGAEVARARPGAAEATRAAASAIEVAAGGPTALEVRGLAGRRAAHRRLVRAPAGRDPRHRGARGRRARTSSSTSSPASASRPAARSCVRGEPLRARHPYDAIRAGVVLVPADRLQALLPQRSIAREHRGAALQQPAPLGARSASATERGASGRRSTRSRSTRAPQRQVRRLSGGNQQKVTIARWLATGFETLLCFDPTRGIDVGTKRQIYALLRKLAGDGAAILLFTSELAEIPLVCDRVVCLYGGRVTAELDAAGGRRGDAAARDARARQDEEAA